MYISPGFLEINTYTTYRDWYWSVGSILMLDLHWHLPLAKKKKKPVDLLQMMQCHMGRKKVDTKDMTKVTNVCVNLA